MQPSKSLARCLYAGKHFPPDPRPSDHLLFLHAPLTIGTEQDARAQNTAQDRDQEQVNPTRRFVSMRFAAKGQEGLKPRKDHLANFLSSIDASFLGAPSVYLSQADFTAAGPKWYQCRREHLRSIGVMFVDLDYYHAAPELASLDGPGVARAIVACCIENGVAPPLVIHSGNGAYAYWSLSTRLDASSTQIEQRWKSVQARLMWVLRDFAPDLKVKDLTRVLRVVGTVNAKTGQCVTVAHDDGAVHDFEALELSVVNMSTHQGAASESLTTSTTSLTHTSLTHSSLTQTSRAAMNHSAGNASGANAVLKINDRSASPRSTSAHTFPQVSPQTSHHTAAHQAALNASRHAPPKTVPRQASPKPQRPPPRQPPQREALIALEKRVNHWRTLGPTLGHVRRHHCLRAADIGALILARKGLWIGMRDETLFWLLNEMFLAGLCAPHELPELCEQFAHLTEGRLDIWLEGYLQTAHDRMVEQIKRSGFRRAQSPVIKRVGCASAVRSFDSDMSAEGRAHGNNDTTPDAGAHVHQKSRAYRARTQTILEKLNVSRTEQATLWVLTDREERTRRRRLDSVRERVRSRNQALRLQAQNLLKHSSRVAHTLSQNSGLSRSTIYRVLSNTSGVSAVHARARGTSSPLGEHARSIRTVIPAVSLRGIARMLGAGISSVHRWLSAQKHVERKEGHNQDFAEPRRTLISYSRFNGSSTAHQTLKFQSAFGVRNCPVPLSHLCADYMGGEDYRQGGRGAGSVDVPLNMPSNLPPNASPNVSLNGLPQNPFRVPHHVSAQMPPHGPRGVVGLQQILSEFGKALRIETFILSFKYKYIVMAH